jgi:hypothetical protein
VNKPLSLVAVVIEEVGSEDEGQQARNVAGQYVPRDMNQDPITIANDSNDSRDSNGREGEHPRMRSSCEINVSQDIKKSHGRLTFEGETPRGVQESLEISNYCHSVLRSSR